MRYLIIISIVLGITKNGSSQQLSCEYSSNQANIILSQLVLDSNNIILGAPKTISGGANNHFFNINSNCDTNWVFKGIKLVNGDQDIKQTHDENLVFASTISPANWTSTNVSDIILLKFNLNGDTLFSKILDSTTSDVATRVVALKNGNIIIGNVGSDSGNNPDFFPILVDSNFNEIKRLKIGRAYIDYLMNVTLNKKGEVILSGSSDNPSTLKRELMFVKTTTNLDTLLTKYVLIGANQHIDVLFTYNQISETSDGGYILTARGDSNSVKFPVILKVDSNFNLQWYYKRIFSQTVSWGKPLEMADSSIVVVSSIYPTASANYFTLYRFSKYGVLIDSSQVNSNSYSGIRVYNFSHITGNKYIVSGRSDTGMYYAIIDNYQAPMVIDTCQSYAVSFTATQQNDTLWLTDNSQGGYSSAHISQWHIEGVPYTGTTLGIPISGLPDSVNISLVSTNYYGCIDSTKRKEAIINSIKNPYYTQQIKLYPNPTTGKVNIQLPTTEPIQLTISNTQGQEIQNQIVQNASTIDISIYPQGIYLFKLHNQHGNKIIKVVKTH
jgi:hypothetical protein